MRRTIILKTVLAFMVVVLLPAFASSQETYKFERMWPTLKQPWYFSVHDISIGAEGSIYMADTEHNRIQKFNSDGAFVSKWGSLGSGDGEFNHPKGIAIDPAGYIYVADTNNNRIQKFSSDGALIGWWGKDDTDYTGWHDPGSGRYAVSGSGDGEFNRPKGIAIDQAGYIYVADTYNHRIQKFSSVSTFVSKWGSYGSDEGDFDAQEGIAIDASGYIYVADTNNNRIQKFSSDGTFIFAWESGCKGIEGYHWASGIAVDAAGHIYISDMWENRIKKFSPD